MNELSDSHLDRDADELLDELEAAEGSYAAKVLRFMLNTVGLGGVAGAWSEVESENFFNIIKELLALEHKKMAEMCATVLEVQSRLSDLENQSDIQARMADESYLALVRKCFRDWSATESEQKRQFVRNLLVNAAAAYQQTSDEILSLYARWINEYSEKHFNVLSFIYLNQGCTRQQIWQGIGGQPARDDSADADLFKMLMHDLQVGHLIRQNRDVDHDGRFFKKSQRGVRKGPASPYIKSAFADEEPHYLTKLGGDFVHYVMTETVHKIEHEKPR